MPGMLTRDWNALMVNFPLARVVSTFKWICSQGTHAGAAV